MAASAHAADVRSVVLSDPQETSCGSGACTPDIASVAIAYDRDGGIVVSATFYAPLQPYDPLAPGGPTRVRINVGTGLTLDRSQCRPVGDYRDLSAAGGDIRLEAGAYNGGTSPSAAASGILRLGGGLGALPVTRTVSSDARTLTLSASSPALARFDVDCAQADLVDDSDAVGAPMTVRDAVPFAWFPGWVPLPSISSQHFLDASETTATFTAYIEAGGGPATAHINVGAHRNQYTAAGPDTAPFTTSGWITLQLTGLSPGTTYHYQVAATALDTRVSHPEFGVFGPDYEFTTEGTLPRPSLIAAPTVRGAKKAGALLTCNHGSWRRATAFTFRWLRDGRRIARASSRHYRVKVADRAHALRCSVTARGASGSAVSASRAVRIR